MRFYERMYYVLQLTTNKMSMTIMNIGLKKKQSSSCISGSLIPVMCDVELSLCLPHMHVIIVMLNQQGHQCLKVYCYAGGLITATGNSRQTGVPLSLDVEIYFNQRDDFTGETGRDKTTQHKKLMDTNTDTEILRHLE